MEKDKEQLIEAYFSGNLTADQQKRLGWLLEHDPAFSETFTFEKEVRDTIIFSERQNLKDRFRTLDQQAATPTRKLTPWWYAAAGVLVVIGALWFFWEKPSETSMDQLYAQYMEPYPNLVTPSVRGNLPADKMMAEALALYDKQAYAEAAALLKQVHQELPNDETAFYLAICHLMLGESDESIALLESRSWVNSTYFSPTVVNWYLGLAFLQQDDREQALVRFKQVAGSDERLANQAGALVKTLRNR